MKKISVSMIIVVSLSIILFNVYSLSMNITCHTGFDTSGIFYAYAVLSVFSVIMTLWCIYKKGNYKFFLILFFICITGMINIKVFENHNVMMQYEDWIEKGMPEKFQ